MKLQHLTIAACILVATISCNSSSTTNTEDTAMNAMSEDTSMSSMMHDDMGDSSMHHMQMCVMMEDDKMMVMDSGKTSPMTEMITMDNGTKVNPDGSFTTADGKTDKLKNGDCIMKDGSKTTMDKMPM